MKNERLGELIAGTKGNILVFKNNSQIETIAKENGWHLLNPTAALAEKIENKITQVEWLGNIAKEYLPETTITKASLVKWNGKAIVIQWAHGHTGDGTILVDAEKKLADLQAKFPERMARVTDFVKGPIRLR